MNHYPTFEVSEGFADKLKRDTDILWQVVYSISGKEPEFETTEERVFARTLGNDYIDNRDSHLTVQQYILQVYGLERAEIVRE